MIYFVIALLLVAVIFYIKEKKKNIENNKEIKEEKEIEDEKINTEEKTGYQILRTRGTGELKQKIQEKLI